MTTQTNGRDDYHLVSPTALLVADFRRFTDIPNSDFIAEETNAEQTTLELMGRNGGVPPAEKRKRIMWIAPYLENRFKSVDREIQKSGRKNVVCVAEGISARPYNLTEDPEMKVVATDLPDMIGKQASLVRALCARHATSRPNLYTRAVDVVNQPEALMAAVELATEDGRPFVMNSEGLIPYFNRDHQDVWFRNSYGVCAARNGLYVTTDMLTKGKLEQMMKVDPLMVEVMEVVSGVTKSDLMNNAFDDAEQAVQMAFNAGWGSVERVRPYQGGRHYSLAAFVRADLTAQEIARTKAMLDKSEVWVFRP